jgi:hypothetical protein
LHRLGPKTFIAFGPALKDAVTSGLNDEKRQNQTSVGDQKWLQPVPSATRRSPTEAMDMSSSPAFPSVTMTVRSQANPSTPRSPSTSMWINCTPLWQPIVLSKLILRLSSAWQRLPVLQARRSSSWATQKILRVTWQAMFS